MADYQLYCFHHSGNSFKVAQYLVLAGVNWEPVFVDFRSNEMRSATFRSTINALGEVPVLGHNGQKISQSGVILDYLVDCIGLFGPKDKAERYEILRWLLFDNNKFTIHLATHRYGTFVSPRAYDPAVMRYLRARILDALDILEDHFSRSPFVVDGKRPTIADFSISGYLLYPEDELGLGLSIEDTYPSVFKWLARIRDLPGWKPPYDVLPAC